MEYLQACLQAYMYMGVNTHSNPVWISDYGNNWLNVWICTGTTHYNGLQ